MYKILNNAELYLYHELYKINIDYAEEFLIIICGNQKHKVQKSSSFENLCNKFFMESNSINNTPLSKSFTNSNRTSVDDTSSSNQSNNSSSGTNDCSKSSSPNKSSLFCYSPHTTSPNKNNSPISFSPKRNNSPLTSCTENMKMRRCSSCFFNKSESNFKSKSFDCIMPTIKNSPQETPKKKQKGKRPTHYVSLNQLNDDIIKYKFLYYTDNSYVIPKHISKLLEVIYNINQNKSHLLSI